MKFTKMHGSGRDYVFVDCFSERAPRNPHGLAVEVSDRQRGIGADGLVLVEASESADARMRIYSAHGEEAGTCTNALRCVAKYLFDQKGSSNTKLTIETEGRVMGVEVFSTSGVAQFVKVDMGPPILKASQIPTQLASDPEHDQRVVNSVINLDGLELPVTCVSMGSPHCVVFAGEVTDELVLQLGPILEHADVFPERTNVEFVEIQSPTSVRQRTWQRGIGEAPASGEGASAACVAGVLTGKTARTISTQLPGGQLQIEWDEATNHVHMTGSAVEVFSGKWNGLS